jgi:crotonobetaine/carnitine-CoA ligase
MSTTNLAQLLLQRSSDRPDLRVGTIDDQMLLPDAVRIAAAGAQALQELGIRRDQRLAIVANNSTEYMLVWMACLLSGTPVALVNPTYPPELLAQMLERLDPAAVFTDLDTLPATLRTLPLSTARAWSPVDPQSSPGLDAAPSDLASFMHTSGTTGVPKFCAQSHEYFLRLGSAMADALGLQAGDRMLAPLPLFHINPMGYGILGALWAGADALTVRKFSASGFWPAVREHGITALALHAPPVEILKRATTTADSGEHSVRTMFYADREFMSRFGIPVAVSGYGSTEAAGVSHLHRWSLADESEIPANASRFGGQTRSDVEDRLDDDGQIYVRETAPNTLFAGYFRDGAVDPNRDANGWFATGDLGRRDDEGGLVFLERAAESIRVKGEFVPIPYVEERLGTIDALTDLALWKKPGELVDDDVVLYVVADSVPLESIRDAVADLPVFMRPAHIARVATIPRDAAAGKVQRRLLHEQHVLSWTAMS